MNKLLKRAATGAALSAMSLAAMADGTTPDTSAITTAGTNVAIVGAAVFAVVVGVKVFKWFARTL